jgi:hypothetical protein
MKNKRILWAAGLILFLGGVCLWGCQTRDPFAGKFQSVEQKPEITLDLKANGEGVWTSGDVRVPFRWEVKQEKIWIHAKGGGVLIGTLAGQDLSIDISGDLHPGCPPQSCVLFKRLPEGG